MGVFFTKDLNQSWQTESRRCIEEVDTGHRLKHSPGKESERDAKGKVPPAQGRSRLRLEVSLVAARVRGRGGRLAGSECE